MNSEKHQATYQSLLPARRGQDKARTMSSDPATPITMLVTCIHNTCYTHHKHQHHFQHSMHASKPFKNICHTHIITGHSTHHTSKLVITHSCHQSLTLIADTSTPSTAHTNTINTSRNTHQHQSHNSSHQSHNSSQQSHNSSHHTSHTTHHTFHQSHNSSHHTSHTTPVTQLVTPVTHNMHQNTAHAASIPER